MGGQEERPVMLARLRLVRIRDTAYEQQPHFDPAFCLVLRIIEIKFDIQSF